MIITFYILRIRDDFVRLDEPPQRRIIPPCNVIVQPQGGLSQLAGITIVGGRIAGRAADFVPFVQPAGYSIIKEPFSG